MEPFVYQPLPTRVLFGRGAVTRIKDEAERLGVKRALVLSTPGRGEALAKQVSGLLGERSAGIHAGAVMHTPVEATERALLAVKDKAADAVIAVGGGSTTGLSKAIALRTDLPQIVLPTTYAGSEVTPILGETQGGVKTAQKSARVLPEVVIYDVDLAQTHSVLLPHSAAYNLPAAPEAMARASRALGGPGGSEGALRSCRPARGQAILARDRHARGRDRARGRDDHGSTVLESAPPGPCGDPQPSRQSLEGGATPIG